jgi:hypothetical protein
MATPAPNATPSKSRRLLVRLPLTVCVLVPTIAPPLAAGGVSDPVAEESDEYTALLPERQFKIADPLACRWVFGDVSDTVAARRQLDTLLGKKIDAVHRICGLTDAQKQKCQLAGRRDNMRFIDRVEEIAVQLQLVKDDPDKIKAVFIEAQRLQRGFKPGFRDDSSLFVKVLEKTLTIEQRASYGPLRAVFRVGGVVQTYGTGADEVLEVNLNFTAAADDELAHLSKLAGLRRLRLDHTQVTDAGLEHLKRLTSMRELDLSRTRVTDAGLKHLQELVGLRVLDLEFTQVSDAGVAELQRALPGLRIEK